VNEVPQAFQNLVMDHYDSYITILERRMNLTEASAMAQTMYDVTLSAFEVERQAYADAARALLGDETYEAVVLPWVEGLINELTNRNADHAGESEAARDGGSEDSGVENS
jgi:hypothetical protein